MSSIIPQDPQNLCGQTSDSVAGVTLTIPQRPEEELQLQLQTDCKPEPKVTNARKRSRKANPAGENPGLRPPADVSLSRIGRKSYSGGLVETHVGTIPDVGYHQSPLIVPTNVTEENRVIPLELRRSESAANIQYVVSNPLTPLDYVHAKLPNFIVYRSSNPETESDSVSTVFPYSTFKTSYSTTRFARDFSSLRISGAHSTKLPILKTVYNPNGESISSEKQGKKYTLNESTLIVVHPVLKIRDSREFVAALPIPRTGGEFDTNSPYLKRVVIARHSGIESHVNIRVEDSNPLTSEADRSSVYLLNNSNRRIGKLTDFVWSPSHGTEQFLVGDSVNQGSVNRHDHMLNKLASPNPAATNNSTSESKRPITPRSAKGYLVLCENCGINSQDLLFCESCKKPIKGVPKLTHDPNMVNIDKNRARKVGEKLIRSSFGSSPVTPVVKRKSKKESATAAKECIITLSSSDEESDTAKLETKVPPICEGNSPSVQTQTVVAVPTVMTSVNGVFSSGVGVLASIPMKSSFVQPKFSPVRNNVILMSDTATSPTSLHTERTESTPEQAIAQMEAVAEGKEGISTHIMLNCRSIRIGSYKVAPEENKTAIRHAYLSSLGVLMSLPHCSNTNATIKIVIPIDCILSVHACFRRLQCLYISTGPKHAAWIRNQLGMGNETGSEYYFCPLEGRTHEKLIVLLMEKPFKDLEKGSILRIFGKTLTEINYDAAHKMLLEANVYEKHPPQQITSPPAPAPPIAPVNVVIASKPVEQVAPKLEPAKLEVPSSNTIISNQIEDAPKEVKKLLKIDWGIELLTHDLESLKDEQFLNDQIIDFWLKYINRYCLSPEDKSRTYIFSSFFYSKLTNKPRNEGTKLSVAERRHARVAKWTRKEDLFKYDFILVPIVENSHWILAVICFPSLDGVYDCDTGEWISELKLKVKKTEPTRSKCKVNNSFGEDLGRLSNDGTSDSGASLSSSQNVVPNLDLVKHKKSGPLKKPGSNSSPNIKRPCILIFDSLAQEARNKIYSTLREYLRIEYKSKKGVEKEFNCHTMPGCMPKVPQQPNFCDCGLYLLQYAESFFSDPIKSFKPPIGLELKNWFKPSVTQQKRKHIYDSIVELVKKENPENIAHIPQITFNTGFGCPEDMENVVSIKKGNEDAAVDVSTVSSNCEPTKRPKLVETQPLQPTTNAIAAVLDHDYVAVQKLESASNVPVNTFKAPPPPAISPVPNPAMPQPQLPSGGVCEPSKISLVVPSLSLKPAATTSTSVNSSAAPKNPTPVKKLPCYANANTPVRKSTTEKILKCNQLPDNIMPVVKEGDNHIVVVPEKFAVSIRSTNPVITLPKYQSTSASQPVCQKHASSPGLTKIQNACISTVQKTCPEPKSEELPRPVREKKDSWKVRDMKTQNNNEQGSDQEESPQNAHSSLSHRMIASISGSMTAKVSGKGTGTSLSPQSANTNANANLRRNDRRSQSPAKKRSKMESDKT